jgi:uncharacterized protein YecE (DUF72 family)
VNILTGCSGWSYTDWVGPFYPRSLAGRHSEWLRYYSSFFITTEVNSTFYSIPGRATVNAWIDRTSDIAGFQFSLKLPQKISHELLPSGKIEEAREELRRFEEICIVPLQSAGRMGAALLQLPPDFRRGDPADIDGLRRIAESMAEGHYDIAVEFRDRSWLSEGRAELRSDITELLSDLRCSQVFVDSPAFMPTSEITAEHAYFRFHGRNQDIWYQKAGDDDSRINRYDYLYSRGQLESWIPRIHEASERCRTVRIYFNNHGRAKAAKNALEMMDMLGIRHQQKEIHITDQVKLGSF